MFGPGGPGGPAGPTVPELTMSDRGTTPPIQYKEVLSPVICSISTLSIVILYNSLRRAAKKMTTIIASR